MCGEQLLLLPDLMPRLGSSPRVRGTECALASASYEPGIIPACAGNSSLRLADNIAFWDHPRVCGEQKLNDDNTQRVWGSSPRVRGTEENLIVILSVTGIIPACAGNRCEPRLFNIFFQDHPRVCGEQRLTVCAPMVWLGSSPRVRGTDSPLPDQFEKIGIIPACAGNSLVKITRIFLTQDHPRVCGEQCCKNIVSELVKGSSPRVRGTVCSLLQVNRWRGIIPACAGNRSLEVPVAKSTRDHPRVCGEQKDRQPKKMPLSGSSPRVRGTGKGRF